jgi:formylglycine-generating enzyme required for sulfatase activity
MKYLFFLLALIVCFKASEAQHKSVIPGKKMMTIPAGNYKPFFVTKSNKPIKVVAFKMDETAVTNLDFLEFVEANLQWRKSKVNRLFADSNYLRDWESDLVIGEKNKNIYNSPVVHVSWFAAQAYSKWKNKRLPTVAEWELAGNATPKNIKYTTTLTDYILGWYKKPNLPVLPNIKTTYQNVYGLYDMHGLIWEWTFNFNSFISSGDSRGNTEDELKAFCAAGAVNVVDKTDYAGFLRFSYRGSLKGNYCIANLGFRCAKNIE